MTLQDTNSGQRAHHHAGERSQQWLTALHGKTLPVTLFGLVSES
jgi:hypothetical protein